jgi:hypothetical protein
MINDIKEYFRFRIYENSRILVNNMKDVISETQIFLDEKIYPLINEQRLIIEEIELSKENDKIIWRIIEKDEINNTPTLYIDSNNITELIDVDYIKNIKEKMEDYPKELCGISLLSFMETINHFVYSEEKIDDVYNVFDICMLSSNNNNNVVYELQ